MSIRADKVASVIKRIIANPIANLANEHKAGLATVTSVKMSPDLQIAKVYISVFSGKISPVKFLEILDNKKHELRHSVGVGVRLRFTPDLRFFLDDTLDQMEYINKLLESVPPASSQPGDDESENID